MENNNIMCAYHAWSFSSTGDLVDVPQAHHSGDPEGNARACASRRGCVATYPVMVSPLERHCGSIPLPSCEHWHGSIGCGILLPGVTSAWVRRMARLVRELPL